MARLGVLSTATLANLGLLSTATPSTATSTMRLEVDGISRRNTMEVFAYLHRLRSRPIAPIGQFLSTRQLSRVAPF